MAIDLEHCKDLDAADPMAGLHNRFEAGEEGTIYLDANSLGPLPADAAARLEAALAEGLGRGDRDDEHRPKNDKALHRIHPSDE